MLTNDLNLYADNYVELQLGGIRFELIMILRGQLRASRDWAGGRGKRRAAPPPLQLTLQRIANGFVYSNIRSNGMLRNVTKKSIDISCIQLY